MTSVKVEMSSSSGSQSSGKQESLLVSKVKGLVVRAWRERWSDVQWGISLKRAILSNPPTSDTKDLSDMLLRQALVGAHPNTLILSYLRHATFSKLLPVTSTFKFITQWEDFSRPHCLLALIELAKQFTVHMGFSYGAEGGVSLCQSLQGLVYWLLKVMLFSVKSFQETNQPEPQNILHAAALTLHAITNSSTVNALLYIACSEGTETFCEMEQTEINVRGTLSQIPPDNVPADLRHDVSNLTILKNVKSMMVQPDAIFDVTEIPICPTIVAMVALEAVLNPTTDLQPFVEQLLVLEKLMKLKRSYLFCEMFRGCFMGLVDTKMTESLDQFRWCAFTYLKVPKILNKIQQQSPSHDFSADLEAGFEKLIASNSLLDIADTKHNCDLLDYLVMECVKCNLLTDSQHKRLAHKRGQETQRVVKKDQQSQGTQPYPSRILHAELTANTLVKSLEADSSKNQETLNKVLGLLQHWVSGENFDLVLAAAAATGKLKPICYSLTKHNEFSKQSIGDGGKLVQMKSILFDLTFLMLCHITQLYGSELITSSRELSDSFFAEWVTRCLPEDGKYKCVDISMPVDSSKVDFLLSAFTQGTDFAPGSPKWHEICMNTPYAIQEVLFAWEHGSLSSDSIKMILTYVKNRMLCLPVVVVAWMCSYINMLGEEARTKPLSMLQQLIQPASGDPATAGQYYTERCQLMQLIVQKMIQDILPPFQRRATTQYVPANTLPSQVMASTISAVFNKGWLEMEKLRALEALINLCGSDWFTDRIVTHMLESYRVEDMTMNLSLGSALMHIDLEHLTLSLLLHTLPNLLLAADKMDVLTDPRGYTLAKFTAYAITAAQTAKTGQKENRRGRKRSRKEFDLDDLDDIDSSQVPLKRMKTMEPQLTLETEGFNFDFLNVKEESETSPSIDTKDPLNKALMNLFRLMNAIVHDGEVTPKTSFIISLVDEATRCGHHARYILQFMPPTMLSQIMKCIPGVFDNEKLLQICDLSTNSGRKMAAKAVCQNARLEKS